MEWKEIRKSGEIFERLPDIWQAEKEMPRWFRDANDVWTPALENYIEFVEGHQEIYGLFDGDVLHLCIHFERQVKPSEAVIHLSVLKKVKPSVFVLKCSELRNAQFRQGVTTIRAWVQQKNLALCKLLSQIGFSATGLILDCGQSHGQVLRWSMVEVKTG